MVDVEYAVAYSELLEILKYIPIEDYNKIPKNKIELFETNSKKDYNFVYNPNLTLDEQNVSKITKIIIAILFRDYWATPQQREKIIAKEKYDKSKMEKEKREKYDPNDLFKNKKVKETQNSYMQFSQEENNYNQNLPVEVKKQSLFDKIIGFFKNLFKH